MGRKRLLTILAGVVAAVGLHMGPAVALDLEIDLGVTKVEASVDEDGVEAKVGDDGKEAGTKVSKDGVEAKVGDTEVSTKDATEPVEKPAPDAGPDETNSTTKENPSSSGDSSASTSSSGSSSNGVTTAGGAESVEPRERPDALSPEEARQFLASSRESVDISGPRGDVTPAFDLSGSDDDLADPLIAAPSAPSEGTSENEWQAASPETASPRSDAELAAIPGQSPNEVPAGLKLIAGLLVAGTGTLWHLTRRELQPVKA